MKKIYKVMCSASFYIGEPKRHFTMVERDFNVIAEDCQEAILFTKWELERNSREYCFDEYGQGEPNPTLDKMRVNGVSYFGHIDIEGA